jgi:hypothetical protein
MEGKRDEVLASRAPRSSQAHVAVADVGDTGTVPDADDDDFEVTDLTSIKLAAMSITRPISAESIAYSSYAMSTITKSPIPNSTMSSHPHTSSHQRSPRTRCSTPHAPSISFATGSLFWSYDPAGAKSVGTANCGTLETLAAGDVKLRLDHRRW